MALDREGNLYVVSESTLRVLRPSAVAEVPLGSNTESARLDVDQGGYGLVTLEGRPVFSGHSVVASDGRRYSLSQRANGSIVSEEIEATAPLRASVRMSRPESPRIATLAGTGRGLSV